MIRFARITQTANTSIIMLTAKALSAEVKAADADQADTTKGESGQVNVHALIYSRRPSPWQDISTTTAEARINT